MDLERVLIGQVKGFFSSKQHHNDHMSCTVYCDSFVQFYVRKCYDGKLLLRVILGGQIL